MKRLTFDDFKDHKIFLFFTFVMAFLTIVGLMTKPEYVSNEAALVLAIIFFPLDALWFKYFWNIVIAKLFHTVPELSYGAACIVAACFYWFLS